MSWPEIPLRRIFRIVNGGTPIGDEKYWNGDVNWATPVDIGSVDGGFLASTQRRLTEEGVRAGSRTVPDESLLLSTRAPIGYVAQTTGRTAFNQGCRGLVATVPADMRYFRYELLSLRHELVARGAGSTFMELSTEALAAVPLACPPIEEQCRIADFLDAETSRIDKLMNLQAAARTAIRTRTVAQLDNRVDELATAYGLVPFRRMICSIEQGSSPQCENFAAGPDDWGVLKVSAVKNGSFVEEENKQLPADIEPERRYEIKHGDLVITRANTPQLVGAAAVADSPRRKLMLCDKIFRVSTTAALLPEFLVLVSLGTRIRDVCAEASHGSSPSMANLKSEEIKRWPIPAAPIPVQRAAIEELSESRSHATRLTEAIDRQLALLAERRQALITAAVTGGITV